MATIARMIVEMAADASGVRRAFRETIADAQNYGQRMRQAVNATPAVDTARFAAMGRQAADGMVKTFTATYNAQMSTAREQLARNTISPAQFRLAGTAAATEFNKAVLDGISDLRNHRMLPPDVHNNLVNELKQAGIDAGREARTQISNQLRNAGGILTSVGQGMEQVGRRLTTTVTLPLLGIGAASIKMAADAAESANKFSVIMGPAFGDVDRQLSQLHRSIPLTTAGLRDATSEFAGLFTAMGFIPPEARRMSVEMVRVAGDISSLHNVPLKETLQGIESGLVGQTRALRRYHIDASEAALAQRALDAGIKGNIETMDRHTKTLLIYNSIIRDSSDSMGDAAATAGSAANTFRFLTRDLQEAAVTIGRELLPVVVPLVQSLSRVLQIVTTLSPHTLDMAIKFALIAAAVGPLLVVLGSLTTVIGGMITVIGTLIGSEAAVAGIAGVLALLAGPAGWIILFGTAAAALAAWAAHVRGAKPDVDELARSFEKMKVPELSDRFAQESRKMLELQRQAAGLRAEVAVAGTGRNAAGEPVRADAQRDFARIVELRRINGEIENQQTLLNGLGTAWQKQASTQYSAIQQEQRNLARYNAFVNALRVDPNGETVGSIKAAAAAAKAAKAEQRAFMSELQGTVVSLLDLRKAGITFGQDLTAIDRQAVQTFDIVQAQIDKAGGAFDATTARLFQMRAELLKVAAVAREMELHNILRGDVNIQHMVQQTPTVDQARVNRDIEAGGGRNVVVQPIVQPVTVLPVTPGRIIPNGPNERGPAQAPPELNEHVVRFRLAIDGFLGALGTSRAELAAIGRSVRAGVAAVMDNLRPLTSIARALISTLPAPLREAAAIVAKEIQAAGHAVVDGVRETFSRVGAAVESVGNRLGVSFKPALDVATTALNVLAIGANALRQVYAPLTAALIEVANPLAFFGQVMTEVGAAIRPIFEPLRPVLTKLAAVVADTLGPVFEALAPVLEGLIPIVRAVMQVLAPILTALAPLFRALGIILEALFPIFKLVAIAATYVGQAFGIVANIVLRAVGNIIIGLGKIVEAFARAVDALPFVSAKGAIATAQGIQNFGRSLLYTADEMKNMANEMARARGEIGKVTISHDVTADKVDKLGDAAATAAEQLLFVPQIFRYRARLTETWEPREFNPGAPTDRPPGSPTDANPSVPTAPAASMFAVHGDVYINTSGDGEETLDNLKRAVRRDAMRTYGDTSRSGDVMRVP